MLFSMSISIMRPLSCTSIFVYLFLCYIIYSTYIFYTFLFPPECPNRDVEKCLNPAFKSTDIFQLFLCTSITSETIIAVIDKQLNCYHHNVSFNLAEPFHLDFQIELPPETLNNNSLYQHVILTKLMNSYQVTTNIIRSKHTVTFVAPLTRFLIPQENLFNLLKSDNPKTVFSSKHSKRPVIHWRSKIIVNGLQRPFSLFKSALPYEMLYLFQLDDKGRYLPIIFISDARQRLNDLRPLPKDKKPPVNMQLEVIYEPVPMGRLRLMVLIEKAFATMQKIGFGEREIDDGKGIFFETNASFLLLTVLIISFHALFDFLAFKNDIQFWRHRETMAGLSFNSILWRFISQFIITLYLMDQESSKLITIPSMIATLIELWKMKKLAHIELKGLRFVRKADYQPTNLETKTAELDSLTLKILSYYILPPLLGGGAVYSILYVEHKSFYSWAIQSAVNGAYCFGFISMLPQLFINYKLKSVAHLPWRAFMYKAFNTFIDDFFAFLIPSVPISHRLATFRDDIIFLIYLYQRWLYPIDRNRVIESQFGDQSLADMNNEQTKTMAHKKND
ncbi:lipid scramblase CLPTM1L [Dermatophagoides pteronyssinus]|uniref:lipid scramblase CLPTM1L n=1 Tax=Dermatophagoides pteronyssinus TaxID=6956 RepID=UPI003F663F0D